MVSNPLIWFLQNSRWPRGNAYIHIHHSQRIFTWGSKPFPLWHRLRQNAKWFWRFNLTGLVWLVSKTSKNHKIGQKKVKWQVIKRQSKDVKRYQHHKTVTKYDPKSASISGPCRTVWNGSSVIFSRALERFGTVQEASNYFELFRTISNYFAFGLFLPSNGLERFKCTVKASRKNIFIFIFKVCFDSFKLKL